MSILISILASLTPGSQPTINTRGWEQHTIADNERSLFQINDSQLKNAMILAFGRMPDDAFLTSFDPWGRGRENWVNLYLRNNSPPEVKTVMRVQKTEIKNFIAETINETHDFENIKGTNEQQQYPYTFSRTFTVRASESIRSTWQFISANINNLSFKAGIEIALGELGSVGRSATESQIIAEEWGKNSSRTLESSITDSSTIGVVLEPDQRARAKLSAIRNKMVVDVTYEIYLTGNACAYYARMHQNKYIHCGIIYNVLHDANLPTRKIVKQTINLEYISHVKLTLEGR